MENNHENVPNKISSNDINFNYYHNMSFKLHDDQYTVQTLKDLPDEKFATIYDQFKIEVSDMFKKAQDSDNHFYSIVLSQMYISISMMERLQLERRIVSLEQAK